VKTLTDILQSIPVLRTEGAMDRPVAALRFDSRQVQPGDVFVAVRGTQTDGHVYIGSAVNAGVVAVVCEEWPVQEYQPGITWIQVENSARALGHMAANYYEHPSRQLRLVAITGTNGKTTCATLLHELFMELGYKAGLLSTVENRIGAAVLPASHTTPDALSLQALVHDMAEAGCGYVFMEASSHALAQERMAGLELAGGVFTNISHDHLDYHGSFQNYIYAKKRLFDVLPATAFALVNRDDKRASVMVQNTQARVRDFALKSPASYKAKIISNELEGLHLELDGTELMVHLIGSFNAYNLLAAYAVALELGMDKAEVLRALSALKPVRGRFETIRVNDRLGIVDYAHTPDAVEKVLQTIDQLRGGRAQLITVLGCGGDRDQTKRPLMAQAACAYSTTVILTSDNPRSEDPEKILDDMEAGVPAGASGKVLRISSRRDAIRAAVRMASPGSVVLVAGKGHETYQEIKGVRYPFDDRSELNQALESVTQ
jgi:UDP-N-acetylmuramoyl-L-alanyl-D-glutamate--2,6-diaminopimelate ligase